MTTKTNFETWRDALTPDEVLDVYAARRFCGLVCPAKDYCQPHTSDVASLTLRCRKNFMDWAGGDAGI